MNYYIGIDLGTSAMKGILTDERGKIVRQASATYIRKMVGRSKTRLTGLLL